MLADLYEVEELFMSGKLAGGTIRSHVMFRMATRRGRTRPAPVQGKVQSDSAFQGVFTRAVNRLISASAVRKRSIKGDFKGLPYQWGFARHGKQEKDIFLTEEGKEIARRFSEERENSSGPPAPKPIPLRAPPGPKPPTPQVREGTSGIEYTFVPKRREMIKVIHRHPVKMRNFQVTYVYIRRM